MKKVIAGIILIVSFIIINNLARSIYNLWQKQEVLTTAERELQREQALYRKLTDESVKVKDPNYLEKIARDKLFLAKPNEQVVVVPEGQSVKGEKIARAKKIANTPNWKAWLRLFSFPVED